MFRKRLFIGAFVVFLVGALGYCASEPVRHAMGGRVRGERLERVKTSPQWCEGRFRNALERQDMSFWRALKSFLFEGSEHRAPEAAVPVVRRARTDFTEPPKSGLRITWLGHSTLIVEIDGGRFLIDPVWSDYTSPTEWIGPRRFYPPPLPFGELPNVDAIVISHDHYDHLDYPTMLRFASDQQTFVVPLGVGAHLEAWGLARERIIELDWWDAYAIGRLQLIATPARHFSGRGLTDGDQTLWAGWAFVGPEHRVFYSGDTAMFPGFSEIGEKLGPFDVTMIESGAYSALWPDVHLGPEQAVEAHRMVRGRLMIPVHWGLFDLAMHGWTEPVERVLVAAEQTGVAVATPRPGESIEPRAAVAPVRWWPNVPWEPAEKSPVISTGLR